MGLRAGCLVLWVLGQLAAPAWGHGDVHGQIERLTRELRDRPADVDTWLRRARLYELDGDWTAASADLDRAEALAPALAAVPLGRGRMLLAAGRLDEAKSELDRFLARRPDQADGWIIRARVAVRRGQLAQAVADFGRGIDLATSPEPEHFLECARAWASMDPPRWSEAVAVLDRGLRRLGNLPALGLPALEYELHLGRFEAALARLERMGPGAGRPETREMRRGDILRSAGRPAEAMTAYRAALDAVGRLSPVVQARPATQALRHEIEQRLALDGKAAGPVPTVGD